MTDQLGHDVVIEAVKRGHKVISSGGREGDDMKVFVTGVGGQLGHDVVNEAVSRGHEAIGSDIAEKYSGVADGSSVTTVPYVQLDITDKDAVAATIKKFQPDAIIHCAAWTAVDAAEDEENQEKVDRINHLGTQYIADAAKIIDAKMLYLKYFIVRIAWVFGLNGKDFIKTMINVGKPHDTVRVVNDQIGTPTYTLDLARLLVDMIESEKYGYYHATNEGGYISWYDFCIEFYKQYGLSTTVLPVSTAEYGLSKAARPENSRLDKSKLVDTGFNPLPDWKDAVKRYLAEANL